MVFWEGHKILRNLHRRFDWHNIGQIYGGDFAKFCGFLKIYELYLIGQKIDWGALKFLSRNWKRVPIFSSWRQFFIIFWQRSFDIYHLSKIKKNTILLWLRKKLVGNWNAHPLKSMIHTFDYVYFTETKFLWEIWIMAEDTSSLKSTLT